MQLLCVLLRAVCCYQEATRKLAVMARPRGTGLGSQVALTPVRHVITDDRCRSMHYMPVGLGAGVKAHWVDKNK